jgi:type IV secretory pathway TrbD component
MSEQQEEIVVEQPEQPSGETVTEERRVQPPDLLKTINNIIHEGTVRRIMVVGKDRTLLDIPLLAGAAASVILAIYLPWIAAIAAAGALLGGYTVRIERDEPKA